MAFVFKLKRNGKLVSPYWQAHYILANGEPRRKSTGLRVKRRAKELADEWQRQQIKARNMQSEGAKRRAEIIIAMTSEINRKGILDNKRYEEYLEELNSVENPDFKQSPPVRKSICKWLANRMLQVHQSTYESYELNIGFVIEAMGEIGDKPIRKLTYEDLDQTKQELIRVAKERNIRNRTTNYKLQLLKSFITHCYKTKIIESNIGLQLEFLPEQDSIKKLPFTEDEIESLMQACSADWKGAILFGYQTGLRIGNIAKLRWEDFNFKWDGKGRYRKLIGGRFEVTPVKQRKKKEVVEQSYPLTESMMNYLQFIGVKKKGFVFVEVATMHKSSLTHSFDRIMKRANVKKKLSKEEGDKLNGSRSFHSLRHSFNTFLSSSGVPQSIRMHLCGHTSKKVNNTYDHPSEEVIEDAIKRGVPEIRWENAQ